MEDSIPTNLIIFVIPRDDERELAGEELSTLEIKRINSISERYIDKLVKTVYPESDNEIKWEYFHLKSIEEFDNKEGVIKKIADMLVYNPKKYTFVIYCYNTDSMNRIKDRSAFYHKLKDYCDENGSLIAWFSENLEYAFVGYQVELSEREKVAKKFNLSEDCIDKAMLERFDKSGDFTTAVSPESNILHILRQIKDFDIDF